MVQHHDIHLNLLQHKTDSVASPVFCPAILPRKHNYQHQASRDIYKPPISHRPPLYSSPSSYNHHDAASISTHHHTPAIIITLTTPSTSPPSALPHPNDGLLPLRPGHRLPASLHRPRRPPPSFSVGSAPAEVKHRRGRPSKRTDGYTSISRFFGDSRPAEERRNVPTVEEESMDVAKEAEVARRPWHSLPAWSCSAPLSAENNPGHGIDRH